MNETQTPSFIEAYWDDYTAVRSRCFTRDRQYKKLSDQIAALEKRLYEAFTPEEQDMYEKMVELSAARNEQECSEHFALGFRLGGQCIYDVFLSPDARGTLR